MADQSLIKFIPLLLVMFCQAVALGTSMQNDSSTREGQRSLRPSSFMRSSDQSQNERSKQPFNILALGGSITWGAELQDRHKEAYPVLVGNMYNNFMGGTLDVSVDNLAVRATGSDYPSMCIQSLVSDANPDDPDKSYDLILLDFLLNGVEGFPALMQRLRQRYPDAEIVMVELWSLKASIEEEGTELNVHDLGFDKDRKWIWSEKSNTFIRGRKKSRKVTEMETLVQSLKGRSIALPCPSTPKQVINENWFSDDWHHPSAHGHNIIAQTIFHNLIKQSSVPLMEGKSLGTWGFGDKCYNWFFSGIVPLSYEGAQKKAVLAKDGVSKNFLEIDRNGRSIEIFSSFDRPVLLSLGYMSREQPAEYPRVHVYVENDDANSYNEDKASSDNQEILFLEENNVSAINPNKNHLLTPKAHIGTYSPIAYASPGRNIIKIIPMEHTLQKFCVVGIYLCATCKPYDREMISTAVHVEI